MCHPDAPSTPSPAPDTLQEVRVPLPTGEELPSLYAHPDRDGPGVLIVADIYGRSGFYEDLAARLAVAGYRALLPEPFFRQGPLAGQGREAAFARRRQLDDLPDARRRLRDAAALAGALRSARGERRIGYKLGFTSRAKMAQMGLDELIWGRLTLIAAELARARVAAGVTGAR
jgi:dienelactone hydrolase